MYKKNCKVGSYYFSDGTLSLNAQIFKEIADLKMGVLLKKDCSQLLLMLKVKSQL